VGAVTALTTQPGAQLSEAAMHHRKPPLPPAKHRCAGFAASTVSLSNKKEHYSISVSHVHRSTCAAKVEGSLLMQENCEHRRMSATVNIKRERRLSIAVSALHAMWWLQHD
jgi:hypothetical protein